VRKISLRGDRGLGYSLVFGGGGAEAVHAYFETLPSARAHPRQTHLFVERLGKRCPHGHGGEEAGCRRLCALGLDIGLWDIAGKRGLPLYKLGAAVTRPDSRPHGRGGWSKYSERELIAEAERICRRSAASITR